MQDSARQLVTHVQRERASRNTAARRRIRDDGLYDPVQYRTHTGTAQLTAIGGCTLYCVRYGPTRAFGMVVTDCTGGVRRDVRVVQRRPARTPQRAWLSERQTVLKGSLTGQVPSRLRHSNQQRAHTRLLRAYPLYMSSTFADIDMS